MSGAVEGRVHAEQLSSGGTLLKGEFTAKALRREGFWVVEGDFGVMSFDW